MAHIVVIGGGAAGMMAAGRAAQLGNRVRLLEKNDKLGKKIRITGKGRCNLTHEGEVEDFIQNTPGQGHFLYSALYGLDSAATRDFFKSLGVPTKVERGQRVFPESDRAADVAEALARYMKKHGVQVRLNTPVKEVLTENGRVVGVRLKKRDEVIPAEAVIVATGGLSYPATGSTGDGYAFARAAGHRVTKLYPSLVPLLSSDPDCPELMGLSLRNVGVTLKNAAGKTLYKDFGEMLFTHFGVSGPVILSASRHAMQAGPCTLTIDLKPALDEKTLDSRLLRDFAKYANKDFGNALGDLLPQRLIAPVVRRSGIPAEKKVNAVTKEERRRLLEVFKHFTLPITGPAGFDMAVITAGGVDVDEIDPATMESRLVRGLYFAGEVLDVDAYTGGYNLQIAFSTGYAAGTAAGEQGES